MADMAAKCNLCNAFKVPYPFDEAGYAMMMEHLRDMHGVIQAPVNANE